MNSITAYQKFRNLPNALLNIVKRLQDLKKAGKTNSEIEEIIHSLKLPLNYHLFILGNFSELMLLEINEVWKWKH